MTKYNFQYIKEGETVFYKISESSEKHFRNALASWSRQRRISGQAVLFHCKKIVEKGVRGEKIFLGMKITREF